MCTNTLLSCCVLYTVSGVEVKTQADSDDVDITECLHVDKPTIGTLCFSLF